MFSYNTVKNSIFQWCAQGGTRTRTLRGSLGPQPSMYTNSITWAGFQRSIYTKYFFCFCKRVALSGQTKYEMCDPAFQPPVSCATISFLQPFLLLAFVPLCQLLVLQFCLELQEHRQFFLRHQLQELLLSFLAQALLVRQKLPYL